MSEGWDDDCRDDSYFFNSNGKDGFYLKLMKKQKRINCRIALSQINVTVGNLEGNTRKIIDYIDQADKSGADITCFPEMAVCGYPVEDLVFKPHFLRSVKTSLNLIARYTRKINGIVIVGFVDSNTHNKAYNATAVLYLGRVVDIYHKIYLPNYGVFDEKRYFLPGKSCPVFKYKDIRFGLNICEDIWIRESPAKYQAQTGGADLLINISASPYHQGKLSSRTRILKDQAKYNKAVVCYTNLVGGQDELVFDGASLVIDSKGKILTRAEQFKEDLLITDIKISPKSKKVSKTKKIVIRLPDFHNVECQLKQVVLPKNKYPVIQPILRCKKVRQLNRLEQVYQALVLGTHDYVIKNGFKKTVIGLSGGIDSALTAVIAVDALGKDNVTVVTMPSKYTSKATRTDAQRQAKSLGVRLITLPIGQVWEQYLKLLKNEFKNSDADITEENLQARIRGNLLMALSNKFGCLVLSTGNKSEMGVGYCTLYGDMAGGFAVIKDVPKTLVYELAIYRNKTASWNLIPKSVIKREPTAELKPGQKDQDSLPPYAELDPILESYIEQHKGLDDITKKGYSAKLVKKIIKMVDRSEYKRRQGPPGVKITPLAFGKDRRFPIINYYQIK